MVLLLIQYAAAPAGQAESKVTRIKSNLPKGIQLYFATSRLNDGSKSEPSYGGSRHLDLGTGSLEYGTAALRTPSNMASPNQAASGPQYRDMLKADTDLWRGARINFIGCFDEDDLFKKVRECSGKICVYIHGYDKPFEEALQDAAMLFADYSQYKDDQHQIVPILFSWPSAGGRGKYSVDEANIEWSKKAFEHFMDRLIEAKNPDASLDIVSHSMGNRLTFSYFIREHLNFKKPYLNNMYLCSADVDFHTVEAWRDKLEAAVNDMIYIFVSDKDRPLIMSQYVHGEPRLGRPIDPPGAAPVTDPAQIPAAAATSDFWLKLTMDAAEMWFGPSNTDTPDVLAWLQQNPALDQEFGEKSRLIDVSDLALANMGHGLAWPVVSSIMAGYLDFPQLRGRPAHKRPDKTYLAQCGGRPRVLYRYIRLDPF
ncbi:MAG: alpha/beta hydrolase [Candidatus Obscuribacterales bacterium]|nr:alpha/beta hydrolase [Candidatus Obscuribacterales bacterium]